MGNDVVEVLKIVVLSAILFVWVVRYQNIIEEFKFFGYPAWLRDLVGIVKITCAVLLQQSSNELVKIGAVGIVLLMLAALVTHLRVKNSPSKMLPSLSLLVSCALIFYWS